MKQTSLITFWGALFWGKCPRFTASEAARYGSLDSRSARSVSEMTKIAAAAHVISDVMRRPAQLDSFSPISAPSSRQVTSDRQTGEITRRSRHTD